MCVFAAGTIAGNRRFQLFDCGSRIGDHRQPCMLIRIRFVGVDVNEAHAGILERCLGCSREIAQPRPDGNHQVRLACGDIGARRSRYSDGA